MKLPNADKLVVEREKIADYLLNPTHRYGASKAQFFPGMGFRIEAWEHLAEALREHGRTHDVARVRETGFGPRYAVEGEWTAPGWPASTGADCLATGRRHGCSAIDNRLSIGGLMKIKEHDCVVLTAGLPEENLEAGDVGTVVHIHRDGVAYEVEFVTLTGRAVAVATVDASALRPVGQRDINHVRELEPA